MNGILVGFADRPYDVEGESKVVPYPIVRTRLPNGEVLDFESEVAMHPTHWAVGDAVKAQVKGEAVKLYAPSILNTLHVFGVVAGLMVMASGTHSPASDQP